MATQNNGEKKGLTQSFRSQTGYGTAPLTSATKKSTPKTRKYIAKKVLRTDTLIGIALKYAVSVQDLKRENKLWNNDHLFLRDELLIPLTPENEGLLDEGDTIVVQDGFSTSYSSNSLSDAAAAGPSGYPNGAASNGRSSPPLFPAERNPPSGASPPPASFPHTSTGKSSSSKGKSKRSPRGDVGDGNDNNNHGGSSSGSSRSASSITAGQPSVSGGSSSVADDFFSKYDTSIARLRGDVEKMEKNAARLDGLLDSNPLSLPPQALRRQSSSTSGYSRKGSTSSISSVPYTTGSGGERRVRTSAVLLDDDEEGAGGDVSKAGTSGSFTAAAVVATQETPVLMIRSRTNNRQVKSAIDNLQQANDDLFEL